MNAHILSLHVHLTRWIGPKVQNISFPENSHVAYPIKAT